MLAWRGDGAALRVMDVQLGRCVKARHPVAPGRWEDARAAFGQALGIAEVAEALEGRALAAWWLDDATTTVESRAKAYRLYRQAGDARGAARVATAMAFDSYLD